MIELFSFIVISSAIGVVVCLNPVQAVLFLILTFFNVGILLFLLGLEFISYMFVIVYVGAIAVLFLFVVMMLNLSTLEFIKSKTISSSNSIFKLIGLIIFGAIVFSSGGLEFPFIKYSLMFLTYSGEEHVSWIAKYFQLNDVSSIGFLLYNKFYLSFLTASLILLVAMLGSISLTSTGGSGKSDSAVKQNIFDQVTRSSRIYIKNKN